MSLLSKVDQYFINLHHKNSFKPYKMFATSKLGYFITTLFVLQNISFEITEYREEGHLILAGIFIAIALLISFYAVRHLFWQKKIERFEYRMKVFESIILLYTGFVKWQHIIHSGHASAFNIYSYPLIIIILVLGYLLMARIFYLKYIGKISH